MNVEEFAVIKSVPVLPTNRKTTCKALIFVLFLILTLASGCAGKQNLRHDEGVSIIPARKPASKFVDKDAIYPIDTYDPWECFNRDMYVFNYYFDKYLFLPAVATYEWITPDYIEERISKIFDNINELSNLTNNLLQLKASGTAVTVGRIAVNSTIGLAGMYDPATQWGMPEHDEDFGQTLGHYGVGPGPYMVLPILGPSSLRDASGCAVDMTVRILFWNWVWQDVKHEAELRLLIDTLEAIDSRHNIDFRYYQSGSPFEYDMVRMIYLEKRKLDIAK
jgi:phospholipid-binding lipoprotein MlaA